MDPLRVSSASVPCSSVPLARTARTGDHVGVENPENHKGRFETSSRGFPSFDRRHFFSIAMGKRVHSPFFRPYLPLDRRLRIRRCFCWAA